MFLGGTLSKQYCHTDTSLKVNSSLKQIHLCSLGQKYVEALGDPREQYRLNFHKWYLILKNQLDYRNSLSAEKFNAVFKDMGS